MQALRRFVLGEGRYPFASHGLRVFIPKQYWKMNRLR